MTLLAPKGEAALRAEAAATGASQLWTWVILKRCGAQRMALTHDEGRARPTHAEPAVPGAS